MAEIAGAKRTRITWSPDERAEWLWLFEQSGKTAAEFCRDNDLSPATLSLWRSQMPESLDEPSGGLVEITPALLSSAAGPGTPRPLIDSSTGNRDHAVVQLPSGWRIEVPIGADPRWIGEMLQAMALLKV